MGGRGVSAGLMSLLVQIQPTLKHTDLFRLVLVNKRFQGGETSKWQ